MKIAEGGIHANALEQTSPNPYAKCHPHGTQGPLFVIIPTFGPNPKSANRIESVGTMPGREVTSQ